MALHTFAFPISFGDCDPAGIVFYPNAFAWFDRTFHDWLKRFGGHAALCGELDAIGLGLMEANAQFLRPMRDGDRLDLTLTAEKWGRKTLHLAYEGRVAGEVAVLGTEVRGLFKSDGNGMVAAQIEIFRAMVEHDDQGR